MTDTQSAYVAEHYAPRAQSYVASAVHSAGADLDQIEAELRGRSDARVLDLGCGGGHVSYRAAPHVASVIACDLTASMLDAVAATATARGLTNIAVQQAPAEHLPFADGSFDIVLCRFTTHHWADMEAGLREARRVVRPGGRAIFIDSVADANPAFDTHLQTVELLRDPSHVRNYTIVEWISALSRAGFALDTLTPRPLRMDFPVWIARTRASDLHAEAIQSLQRDASAAVKAHFAIRDDGSFDLVVATMVLHAV